MKVPETGNANANGATITIIQTKIETWPSCFTFTFTQMIAEIMLPNENAAADKAKAAKEADVAKKRAATARESKISHAARAKRSKGKVSHASQAKRAKKGTLAAKKQSASSGGTDDVADDGEYDDDGAQ